MNRAYWMLAILVFPFLSSVRAADEDFKSIFDGKTLTGWHKNSERIGHGTGGSWVVEDGAISGEQDPPGSGSGGILLTDEKFKDFELLIDMKPDWGVCSGLFVRSNDKGQCEKGRGRSRETSVRTLTSSATPDSYCFAGPK